MTTINPDAHASHRKMINMKNTITVGMPVQFDSEHGPQTGRVTGFIQCIGNGQRHAAIEVDHTLDGIVWTMPVDQLQPLINAAWTKLTHATH